MKGRIKGIKNNEKKKISAKRIKGAVAIVSMAALLIATAGFFNISKANEGDASLQTAIAERDSIFEAMGLGFGAGNDANVNNADIAQPGAAGEITGDQGTGESDGTGEGTGTDINGEQPDTEGAADAGNTDNSGDAGNAGDTGNTDNNGDAGNADNSGDTAGNTDAGVTPQTGGQTADTTDDSTNDTDTGSTTDTDTDDETDPADADGTADEDIDGQHRGNVPGTGLSDADTDDTDTEDLDDEEEEDEEEEEEEEEESPSFYETVTVAGANGNVRITVSADAGVLPAGSSVRARAVSASEQAAVEERIDSVRDDDANVVASYTYDISILDENGNEIEPDNSKGRVSVSFTLAEAGDKNLDASVYHTSGSSVEKLDNVSSYSTTLVAQTDGFSYYTVEFSYGDLEYVMEGDTEVALRDILFDLGLRYGTVTDVQVSSPELFSASNETGEWIITAHQAFSTEESMTVTIDGLVEYDITVKDDISLIISFSNVSTDGGYYNWEYDGVSHNPFAVGADGGTVSYTYYYDSECTQPVVATDTINGEDGTFPKTHGTYWVKGVVSGGLSSGRNGTCFFEIKQKNVTVSIPVNDKEYDGNTTATPDCSNATINGLVSGDVVTVSATGAVFSSSNASDDPVTVNITGITLGGTDAGNYTLSNTSIETTARINKKAVTVSGITASNKTYDGNTNATVVTTGAAITGKVGTEDVSVSDSATGTFEDKNVGTGKTVNITNLTLSGNDAGNYRLSDSSQSTTTADIAPLVVTVDSGITANDKVYDGNTTATLDCSQAVITGKVSNDTVSVTATGTFSGKNVENNKNVSISNIAFTGTDGGNYQLAATGNQSSTTANIAEKLVTVSFNVNKVYDGNTTANLTTGTAQINGKVDGDTVTVNIPNTVTSAYSDKNAENGKTINITNSSAITLTGADAGNYDLGAKNATGNITKKHLTSITGITANEKEYDGTTTATLDSSNAQFGGMVDGDNLTVTVTGTFDNANAGNGKTININNLVILGGTDKDNYDDTSLATLFTAPITGNITQKSISGCTVTIDPASYIYSGNPENVTEDEVTVKDPGRNNATLDNADYSLVLAATDATSQTSGTAIGTYTIKINGTRNYTGTVTGTWTIGSGITPANQTITYNGSTYNVANLFTIDNAVSTVSYSLESGGTGDGTLKGSTLTITKAGTIKIKATGTVNNGTANSRNVSETATLTVRKGAGVATLSIADVAYGKTITPKVESKTNKSTYTIVYQLEGSTTTSTSTPSAVGKYTATVTYPATDLYEKAVASTTFSIIQQETTKPAQVPSVPRDVTPTVPKKEAASSFPEPKKNDVPKAAPIPEKTEEPAPAAEPVSQAEVVADEEIPEGPAEETYTADNGPMRVHTGAYDRDAYEGDPSEVTGVTKAVKNIVPIVAGTWLAASVGLLGFMGVKGIISVTGAAKAASSAGAAAAKTAGAANAAKTTGSAGSAANAGSKTGTGRRRKRR